MRKGLKVNVGKTNIMVNDTGLDLLQSSGKFSCAICSTCVGSNSINARDASNGCAKITVGSSV